MAVLYPHGDFFQYLPETDPVLAWAGAKGTKVVASSNNCWMGAVKVEKECVVQHGCSSYPFLVQAAGSGSPSLCGDRVLPVPALGEDASVLLVP